MKEKFVNNSLAFINKYQECNDVKNMRLKYGLEGIYSLITKVSTVLILSLIFKTLLETILLMFFYAIIRSVSFGFHAKNNISCWIFTIITYIGLPLIIKYYSFSKNIAFILMLIGLFSIILFAPADTPKRPLIRKNERISLKCKSLIIWLIYFLIIYLTNNNLLINITSISILQTSILINPIFYFLNKTPYNNYKKI